METLVRSWINTRGEGSDYQDDAWQELEEYLRSAPSQSVSSSAEPAILPREIRQAYFDLELPAGASVAEAREAYRRLLRMYHPDRFHNDPKRSHTASEVTQRVSLAYKRLNDYYRN